MLANRQILPRIPGSKSARANFTPSMSRTLTPRAELMLINVIHLDQDPIAALTILP